MSHPRRVIFATLVALAAVLSTTTCRVAAAHELGVIQVKATLDRGEARVELSVDLEHAPARFLDDIERLVHLRFDDRSVAARVTVERPAADALPKAHVLLEADVPHGAKSFAFDCEASIGPYPIAVTVGAPGDDNAPQTDWQTGPYPGRAFTLDERAAPRSLGRVFFEYLVLGFTHIVPKGADHILFVLGLFLLSTRARPLLYQVTAFTLAHTLTLALSIYGVVSLSPRIVEPAIAFSIAAVAIENLFTERARPGRVALVFGFGLLHGLGFAGVLTELGLPRKQALPALLSFNLGVEFGQLAVLAIAFLLVGWPLGRWAGYRRWVVVPGSLAIAAMGLWWGVERLLPS
jgi:hypothetical protein